MSEKGIHASNALDAAKKYARNIIKQGYAFIDLHPYTDKEDNILYWRIRYKNTNGKKWMRPLCQKRDGLYYLEEPEMEGKKPLYGLGLLVRYPDAKLWIVEGENCADAFNNFFTKHNLLNQYIAITSGGNTSAEKADWKLIAGRECIIWPDHDMAGEIYSNNIILLLEQFQCSVSLIDTTLLGLAESGDCVDWLAQHEEATLDDILALPRQNTTSAAIPVLADEVLAYQCMADVVPSPIRWLWPDRIARGKITLIAGNPGLGKSQLTTSLAAIVSTGGNWITGEKCQQGNVAFICAEDDLADTVVPRLVAAGANLRHVFTIDTIQKSKDSSLRGLNLQDDVSNIDAWLTQHPDTALLIIDPITAYMGRTDSHKTADVRSVLAPLGEMAAKHEVAVICISHLNKNGEANAMMRVTGSLAFVAAARASFLVEKDKEHPERRLFLPMKNNIGNDMGGLAFIIQEHSLDNGIKTSRVVWKEGIIHQTADAALAALAPDAETQSALQDAKDFLQELLKDRALVPAKDVFSQAKENNIADTTLRRAKTALGIKPTKASMETGWFWSLPPKGSQE